MILGSTRSRMTTRHRYELIKKFAPSAGGEVTYPIWTPYAGSNNTAKSGPSLVLNTRAVYDKNYVDKWLIENGQDSNAYMTPGCWAGASLPANAVVGYFIDRAPVYGGFSPGTIELIDKQHTVKGQKLIITSLETNSGSSYGNLPTMSIGGLSNRDTSKGPAGGQITLCEVKTGPNGFGISTPTNVIFKRS